MGWRKRNSRKQSRKSPGNHPSQRHPALKWKVQFPKILATPMTEHSANLSRTKNMNKACLFNWPNESRKPQIGKKQKPGALAFQLQPLLIRFVKTQLLSKDRSTRRKDRPLKGASVKEFVGISKLLYLNYTLLSPFHWVPEACVLRCNWQFHVDVLKASSDIKTQTHSFSGVSRGSEGLCHLLNTQRSSLTLLTHTLCNASPSPHDFTSCISPFASFNLLSTHSRAWISWE